MESKQLATSVAITASLTVAFIIDGNKLVLVVEK